MIKIWCCWLPIVSLTRVCPVVKTFIDTLNALYLLNFIIKSGCLLDEVSSRSVTRRQVGLRDATGPLTTLWFTSDTPLIINTLVQGMQIIMQRDELHSLARWGLAWREQDVWSRSAENLALDSCSPVLGNIDNTSKFMSKWLLQKNMGTLLDGFLATGMIYIRVLTL